MVCSKYRSIHERNYEARKIEHYIKTKASLAFTMIYLIPTKEFPPDDNGKI